MDEYDVVIVGGGPAGATAGFFSRRTDPEMSVAIIERLDERKYGRYHRMCGEGVSRAAFVDLGPIKPDHVVHRISKAKEIWPGGTVLDVAVDGYIIDRTKFLEGVLSSFQSAGGVRVNDAVISVTREGGAHILQLTSGRMVRCRYLIGADGSQSMVRRSLFKEEPPVMLWADQYLVDKKLDPDTITFIQGQRYRGAYRWEFPSGDLARIGFPRGADEVPANVVEKHRRAIPMGGLSRIVDGNAMLVGDAAAMANPLTAGGIRMALLSGRRAAEAIAAGDPRHYQDWWTASPFANVMYMKAYRRFEAMTDRDYARAAQPFKKPYSLVKLALAYATVPENRDVIRAYISSDRYGW